MSDQKVTGRFTYDVETKSLHFDFDDNPYLNKRVPSFLVKPVHDEDYPHWLDYDGNPIEKMESLYLTFSGKPENKGLLIIAR